MKICFSGFVVNLVGIFIFQHGGAGHGHSHGGPGDSHGHGHDNGKTPLLNNHGHSHDGGHHHGHSHSHDGAMGSDSAIMKGVSIFYLVGLGKSHVVIIKMNPCGN